jgi:hypothetical protein
MIYSSFSSYSMDSDGNLNNEGFSLSQQQGCEPDIFEYNIDNNNGEGSIFVKRGDEVLMDDIFESEAELLKKLNYMNELNIALEHNIKDALETREDMVEEIADLEEVLDGDEHIDYEMADGILERIGDNEGRIEDIDYLVEQKMDQIRDNEEDLGITESAVGISREASEVSLPEQGIAEAAPEISIPLI